MQDTPVLRLATSNLKKNADKFRADFIATYIKPNQPYPLRTFLKTTDLVPIGLSSQRLLLARKQFTIRQGKITNSTGQTVELKYRPSINNSKFDLSVRFPEPFAATTSYTSSSLVFELSTPLELAFVTLPQTPGAEIIPQFCRLTKLSITEGEIVYQFETDKDGTPDFYIIADLTADRTKTSQSNDMRHLLNANKTFFLKGVVARNPLLFPSDLRLHVLDISFCDCGTEPYTAITAHCTGKTRTINCLGGQHTYTYSCTCGGRTFDQDVQAGNDNEANQLVELSLPC